jgi:hypothetical protein
MTRFRFYRADPLASMVDLREVPDRAALIALLRPWAPAHLRRSMFAAWEVDIVHVGLDPKAGSDQWLVTIGGVSVGYTDGPLA